MQNTGVAEVKVFYRLFFLWVAFVVAGCSDHKSAAATWHMINVNSTDLQGDANLLVVGDTVIMIDGGYQSEAEKAVSPYLDSLKISEVHHFFVSHPHRDHYEGLRVLFAKGVTVKNLYIRVPPEEICDREIPWGCNMSDIEALISEAKSRGVNVEEVVKGSKFEFHQGSTLEVLHAQDGDLPDDTIDVNDLSLIMRFTVGDTRILFTGDLNQKVGRLLSTSEEMKAHFMKMPHHAATSLAPDIFFEAVDPDFVLVPGPRWVWCGDRGERARRWVESHSLPTWVNGIDGNIKVEFYSDHILVSPQFVEADCRDKAFGTLRITNQD